MKEKTKINPKKINFKVLIISLAIVYAVAFIGSLFTSKSVNSQWYESIKPPITPPNYVFPVVWNILFFLIALSLYFSWTKLKDKKDKRNKILKIKLIIVVSANLTLNILWSVFYFALRKPLIAYFDLILLWGTIITMISVTYRIDKKAAYLLIPYLLWTSFAGILNYLSVF